MYLVHTFQAYFLYTKQLFDFVNCAIFTHIAVAIEYSTYREVTTSRLKAPRHVVVHDNLKSFA